MKGKTANAGIKATSKPSRATNGTGNNKAPKAIRLSAQGAGVRHGGKPSRTNRTTHPVEVQGTEGVGTPEQITVPVNIKVFAWAMAVSLAVVFTLGLFIGMKF